MPRIDKLGCQMCASISPDVFVTSEATRRRDQSQGPVRPPNDSSSFVNEEESHSGFPSAYPVRREVDGVTRRGRLCHRSTPEVPRTRPTDEGRSGRHLTVRGSHRSSLFPVVSLRDSEGHGTGLGGSPGERSRKDP